MIKIKTYKRVMDDGGLVGPYEDPYDTGRLRRKTDYNSLYTTKIYPNMTGIKSPVNASVPSSPSYSTPAYGTPVVKPDFGTKVGAAASAIAPYTSNIINMFRKPPPPHLPTLDSPITLGKVNMNADRNEISREVNATTKTAYRNLDANTATKIALFNQGTKLNQLSKVSQQERNENTGIGNQQTLTNAQIAAGNNNKWDEYNQSMVEQNIAQQREQSANIANAADKYVAIGNEKNKAKLDLEKTRVLSSLYSKSGVMNRQRLIWKKAGQADPLGLDYKDLEQKFGGTIKLYNRLKPVR